MLLILLWNGQCRNALTFKWHNLMSWGYPHTPIQLQRCATVGFFWSCGDFKTRRRQTVRTVSTCWAGPTVVRAHGVEALHGWVGGAGLVG